MRWKELDIRFFGQCVHQQYIAFTTAYLLQSLLLLTPKTIHVHMHKLSPQSTAHWPWFLCRGAGVYYIRGTMGASALGSGKACPPA